MTMNINVFIATTTISGKIWAEVKIMNSERTHTRYEVLTEDQLDELIQKAVNVKGEMRELRLRRDAA